MSDFQIDQQLVVMINTLSKKHEFSCKILLNIVDLVIGNKSCVTGKNLPLKYATFSSVLPLIKILNMSYNGKSSSGTNFETSVKII